MGVVISAVGAAVVALVLVDVFHTLWHPAGQGRVSRLIMRSVWSCSRRRFVPGPLRAMTGPLAIVLTVLSWAALVVAGFVLVYWPHLPGDFVFGSGLQPERRSTLLDALYLSLVTVATLGYGDIVPQAGWLRVVSPLQALTDFALLTAAVSWVLQIYPALGRRRALAVHLTTLQRARLADRVTALQPATAALLVLGVASDVARVRVDLTQYSETYYFRETDEAASLPRALGYAQDVTAACRAASSADMRLAGEGLAQALQDLTGTLTAQQLVTGRNGDPADVLRAYRGDHE